MAGMDEESLEFYSKVYPMPGANALAELILKDSEDRKLRKESDSMPPLQISQEFFESAFKFLKEYNNNNTQQQKQQLNGTKKKNNNNCVTVYSSPCGNGSSSKRLKKVQGSTELPQSVKKMMEKDASLRRLLKTGSVTISHIPNPAKNNEDALASSSSTNGIYKVNCKSSNLLRMFAKKVQAATNLERRSVQEKNWSVKVVPGKNVKVVAVNETLLKNGNNNNNNGKKKLNKLDKILEHVQQQKRYSTDSDERDNELDLDCPEIQQPYVEGFDPTRFLEVSFREEESDEHRRKYKCPHCIKKFCWSTDLKRHILTHTGERPFSCEFCPANFTRKFLMQKHSRKHHPDQLLLNNGSSSSIKNPNGSFSNSSITNGHVKIEPEDEVEDDDGVVDDDEFEQDVEPDSPPQPQEEDDDEGGHEESEEFYLPLIRKTEPKPIVINVFSSMRENGHMMGMENHAGSNIISLAAGATISTTEIKPGILAKARPSSRNNNNGSEQKLITLVNS